MSQTVERAISILESLSDGARSAMEVSQQLGVHKTTAFRLLQTLEESGFAYRRQDGKWAVGNRIISIAQRTLASLDVRAVAAPHLRRLEEVCGHTVHLGQLVDKEILYIDKIEGRDSVQMYSRIGKRVETHASGIGKTILAFLDEPLREQIMAGLTFNPFTETTITSRSAFRQELGEIRERGWGRDNGEFEKLINCIAAPIHSSDGSVRTALSITTLRVVSPLDELENLVPELLKTADDISRDYGWRAA
ncbi:IclR family transcriptional regulator [Arthrobacter pigmenti]